VSPFAVPTNLVESIRRNPSPGRREWFQRLPETVRELAERWGLTLGEPYQPGGECSWVAPASDASGQELVLKVGWLHDEAAHEADGLKAWRGRGAVQLWDAEVRKDTSALLLERCRPGTPLGLSLPESEQDVIIAGLLRQLWSASLHGSRFQPLQAMCDAWASEFQQRLADSPAAVDQDLARTAIEIFRGLPATADQEVLLCTDLHAGNVLAAQREPWLVIDPKPHVGDPAYDSVHHMLNCPGRLASDPVGLAHRMADLLEVDRGRVVQWLFARCVQESLDRPALRNVAAALAPA